MRQIQFYTGIGFLQIRKIASLILTATVLLATSCVSAPTPKPNFSAAHDADAWVVLSDFIKADIKQKNIQGGCAVSVADSSGLIWSAGFGKADFAAGTAFLPTTISNVGSVSKLFTATAIMKLVEQGKLDLDAPVSIWLPELKPRTRFPDARAITIRDIMTHHSGLPSDYLNGFQTGTTRPDDYPESFAKNAELVSKMFVANPPGRVFSYSNLSISLLGIMVERASGLHFEEFCQQTIFKPLGMSNSSFVLPVDFDKNDQYAKGYINGKPVQIPYIRDIPAGALNTTVEDLAKFTASFLAAWQDKPGILSSKTVHEMFTQQNKESSADLGFKIGLNYFLLNIGELPGEFAVGHDGALPPFFAYLMLLPERGLAVTAMVNTPVFETSIPTLALEAAEQYRAGKPFQKPAPDPKPVQNHTVATNISGSYASAIGLLVVKQEGTNTRIRLGPQWLDATWYDNGSFRPEYRIFGCKVPVPELDHIILYPVEIEGKPALALGSNLGPTSPAIKIESVAIPDAWKKRLGNYLQVTPNEVMNFGLLKLDIDTETGLLVARIGDQGIIPLRPVSDTACILEGLGRNLSETIEVVDNNLLYNGEILKKQ